MIEVGKPCRIVMGDAQHRGKVALVTAIAGANAVLRGIGADWHGGNLEPVLPRPRIGDLVYLNYSEDGGSQWNGSVLQVTGCNESGTCCFEQIASGFHETWLTIVPHDTRVAVLRNGKVFVPEPVEHPDLRALCEWCETWKMRALTAEGRVVGAEVRRDEDRKQWERERDSFANRVMQAERKRDEAEARFKAWASEDWANAQAGHDALKRVVESQRAEIEAERAGRKDAEASLRSWKASFNVAHVNNDKLEAENEALIAAAEGRTTPKCFMCTPLLEHVERMRVGIRRGREAGQRFRAGAGLVLHRMGGAVWRILHSDLLFRVAVLAALVGLVAQLMTVEVRPPRVLFDRAWPRQRADDVVAPVVSR